MEQKPVTSEDIRIQIEKKFPSYDGHYVVVHEVGNGTGYKSNRRLDTVVIDTWPSEGLTIHGIEIKISKDDLKNEFINTEKHNIFYPNLDYFSLACPASILDKSIKEIIPANWGIYSYYPERESKQFVVTRRPLMLHDEKLREFNIDFAVALLRKACLTSNTRAELNEKYHEGYRKGLKEGQARGISDYEKERYEKLEKENEKYRKLFSKIKFFYDGDLDKAVEFLEAYRKVYSSSDKKDLETLVKVLPTFIKLLPKSRW